MDFNVKDGLKRFSKSGWFNSSLGDLCVYGCINLLKIPVVVITSFPGSPVLTFVPSTLPSKRPIYIAYNHSSPGHYDGTKGELIFCIQNFLMHSFHCPREIKKPDTTKINDMKEDCVFAVHSDKLLTRI